MFSRGKAVAAAREARRRRRGESTAEVLSARLGLLVVVVRRVAPGVRCFRGPPLAPVSRLESYTLYSMTALSLILKETNFLVSCVTKEP